MAAVGPDARGRGGPGVGRGRGVAACRRTRGDREEAVHGVRHGVGVGGWLPVFSSVVAAEKIIVERIDHAGDRRRAKSVPVELRPGPRLRPGPGGGVRRPHAFGQEGSMGGRRGDDEADPQVRRGVSERGPRLRRVRGAAEGERRGAARRGAGVRPRPRTQRRAGDHLRHQAQGERGHHRRAPRLPHHGRGADAGGERAGLLAGVDPHRRRLPRLSALPPHLGPGAGGARLRHRRVVAGFSGRLRPTAWTRSSGTSGPRAGEAAGA